MHRLEFDEFLRSMKQNIDMPHSMLLGAGASIESGIQSASDCIWDWKNELYLSQNPIMAGISRNLKLDSVKREIQNWIDQQGIYPEENSDNEYSYYAEKTYPIPEDRRKYFEHLTINKSPSLGYYLIAAMAQRGIIKSVWTTNFDGMMEKCTHQYGEIIPVAITLDSVGRIYRGEVDKELLCISLHGDYKFGELKNTQKELDTQNSVLIQALSQEMTNRDLIVIGYSGRDHSLMDALTQVYQKPGAGKLFWCGYGDHPSAAVCALLQCAENHGRGAYYIATDGFDNTMYMLSMHCLCSDGSFIEEVNSLKKKLGKVEIGGQSRFQQFSLTPTKIVGTNLHPIVIPQSCYQFEYGGKTSAWKFCHQLTNNNIMAVPRNGMIYAWGDQAQIIQMCKDAMKSPLHECPLPRETIIKTSEFYELLCRTLTRIIADGIGCLNSRYTVYDKKKIIKEKIGGRILVAYEGVKLSAFFDKQINYITILPTYSFEENISYTKDEKKEFSDRFYKKVNAGKPNLGYHKYIESWENRIFKGKNIKAHFPPQNSHSEFQFSIGMHNAFVGIENKSGFNSTYINDLNPKQIVLKGVECRDPDLRFWNEEVKNFSHNFHPMRGLINSYPYDRAMFQQKMRPLISLGVICPQRDSKHFGEFLNSLNTYSGVRYNTDYVIPYPGYFKAFKTGLQIPQIDSPLWALQRPPLQHDSNLAARELGHAICRNIDKLASDTVDVILIYIPKEWEEYTSYSQEGEEFDLHNFIKAYAAQKQIATQLVREKTICSDLICQIKWALALAIYVKAGGTPWTVTGIKQDTAFAGIGYSVNRNEMGTDIVIGCSHIYSSDGQGMKYKLSKIQDVAIDRKRNPYLSENEAYHLGLNIKELFYRSFSELPKRVVIHKRTPFKQAEIKGLVNSLSSAGIEDIVLLEITYEDDLRCFAMQDKFMQADGFPVKRGLCFPVDDRTMYLFTHGIAPSVCAPGRKYFQGGKSIPIPLKIVKHFGNANAQQIASEILGLTKMDWNSFGLYTKLPCTIESSNRIAQIGQLLSQYEGAVYDYRFFM